MSESDQAWLDTVNSERKKATQDKVSYEVFEIIMDRLEKEWFDLVSISYAACPRVWTDCATDEKHPQT